MSTMLLNSRSSQLDSGSTVAVQKSIFHEKSRAFFKFSGQSFFLHFSGQYFSGQYFPGRYFLVDMKEGQFIQRIDNSLLIAIEGSTHLLESARFVIAAARAGLVSFSAHRRKFPFSDFPIAALSIR